MGGWAHAPAPGWPDVLRTGVTRQIVSAARDLKVLTWKDPLPRHLERLAGRLRPNSIPQTAGAAGIAGAAFSPGKARLKTSYSGPNWARNSRLKARYAYHTGRVTTVLM